MRCRPNGKTMTMNELQILAQQLKEILGEESVLCREPMRRHCSWPEDDMPVSVGQGAEKERA